MNDAAPSRPLFGLDDSVMRDAAWGGSGDGMHTARLHARFGEIVAAHPTGLCEAVCDLLVEETGMEIAMVTRFVRFDGANPTHATATACVGVPEYQPGGEYELAGTPCEHVQEFCFGCVPRQLPELYPRDTVLVDLGVESYAGAALTGIRGSTLGTVLTMSRSPLEQPESVLRVLVVIGQRLAIEIERRRGDRELRAAEERSRVLIEKLPDGLVVHQGGRVVFANPKAAQMRGLPSPADLIGRASECTDRGDELSLDACSGVREIGAGAHRHVVECTASHVTHDGQPAIQIMERDMTRQRRLERRVQRVFEILPDGAALLEPSGSVQRMNGSMRTIMGIEQVGEGVRLLDLLEGEDREQVAVLLRRAEESQAPVWAEYGSVVDRTLRWTAFCDPVEGDLAIGVTDTTAQREAERQLRRAERERSVELLASGLAHDLGNLVAAIGSQLHSAKGLLDTEHPASEPLRDLDEVVGHAAELKDSLAMLSGQGVGVRRPLVLSTLVRDSRALLERLVGESAELQLIFDTREGDEVLGDESRLKQVLVNLVVNARNALDGRDGAEIRVTVTGGEQGVSMCVHDNGPGVEFEVRDVVFDPFFTTRHRESGTGLGLALCRAVVEGHGGSLAVVDSELGGACFTMSLPRLNNPNAEQDWGTLSGTRIYVCESVGHERELIIGMCECIGVEIVDQLELADVALRLDSVCTTGETPVVYLSTDEPIVGGSSGVELQRPFGVEQLANSLVLALSARTTRGTV